MSGTAPRTAYQLDRNLAFCEDMTLTSSDVVALSGSDVIIKLGPGRQFATLIINVTALVVSTNDDIYRFALEGSDSSTFASGIGALARLNLGHTTVLTSNYGGVTFDTSTIGRYEIPFTNELGGVILDYVQLECVMAGTGKSITFDAWIALNSNGG